MSESPLSTHAGPIAVIAGALFAVVHVGQFAVMDRSNLLTMATDPAFQLLSVAYAITFPPLLIALTALYWRQARESGLFGAIAFCTALTGTAALAGDMWFEAFATPWLARVAPVVFTADRSGSSLVTAWLVSMILFSLGWILFGLASLRARIFPRTLSLAVAVGGLIGFQAAMPPWGVALGLAVAAVGVWLVRQDRQERQVQPDSQRVPEPPRVNRSPHVLPTPSHWRNEPPGSDAKRRPAKSWILCGNKLFGDPLFRVVPRPTPDMSDGWFLRLIPQQRGFKFNSPQPDHARRLG